MPLIQISGWANIYRGPNGDLFVGRTHLTSESADRITRLDTDQGTVKIATKKINVIVDLPEDVCERHHLFGA